MHFFEGVTHDGTIERLLFKGTSPVIATRQDDHGFRWIHMDGLEKQNPSLEEVVNELSDNYQSLKMLTDREYYGY